VLCLAATSLAAEMSCSSRAKVMFIGTR
jgi:hypothetical protein